MHIERALELLCGHLVWVVGMHSSIYIYIYIYLCGPVCEADVLSSRERGHQG